jgi:hypothetical protein
VFGVITRAMPVEKAAKIKLIGGPQDGKELVVQWHIIENGKLYMHGPRSFSNTSLRDEARMYRYTNTLEDLYTFNYAGEIE